MYTFWWVDLGKNWEICNVLPVATAGFLNLKGTNTQYSGQMSQNIPNWKALEIQPVRPTEVCGKV